MLASRSWLYREGNRNVWVIETSCKLTHPEYFRTAREQIAYIRGYFDAEGGVPGDPLARFYVTRDG